MENAKVYVEVLVSFDKDGTMSPVEFIWEDGEKYHVDRILARERCASRKAGGVGMRYTVMVNGKESHLYYEFDKWFMERRKLLILQQVMVQWRKKEWQDMLNMHLMNICNFVWKVGSFYCY